MGPWVPIFGFEGPRTFGDGSKLIWAKKKIFEKNAFFYPQMAQFGHKMARRGPVWGAQEVNFGFLRLPDPPGGHK